MPKAPRQSTKPNTKWFVTAMGALICMMSLLTVLHQKFYEFRNGQLNWNSAKLNEDQPRQVDDCTRIAELGLRLEALGVVYPQNWTDPVIQTKFKKIIALKVKNC